MKVGTREKFFIVGAFLMIAGCGGGVSTTGAGGGSTHSGGISTIDIEVQGLRVTRSANNRELSCRITVTLTSKVDAYSSRFTLYIDAYDASGKRIARSTIPTVGLRGLQPLTIENSTFKRTDNSFVSLKTCGGIDRLRFTLANNSVERMYL